MKSKSEIRSYVSPKVVIKESGINKLGMYATQPIVKDEVVFIKGGHILSKAKLFFSEKISSYLPIDDNFFIGAMNEEEEKNIKLYNNHSCDPNCGLRGEITFVAMRNIATGEELTCDYATIDNEDYQFECNCGASCCRRIVTGFDWKKKELQEKYKGYFASYLQKKIDNNSI